MIIRTLSSWRFGDFYRKDDSQSMLENFPMKVGRTAHAESIVHSKLAKAFGLFSGPRIIGCDTQSVDVRELPRESGLNAFLNLIRAGDIKAIRSVVKNVDLRAADEDSWTCLHWAVEMGHRDLVELFLDEDPLLLNMKTKEGLSCINIAAWRGDHSMVQLLLQQGAEIDDRTKWGETPLHHAVTFGHIKVCEILLRAGADPHAEDRLRRTPYQIGMQKGTRQVKKILSQFAPSSQ